MASPFYADCLGADGVFKYFKDNQWLSSKSGKSVKINNPTTDNTEFLVQGALMPALPISLRRGSSVAAVPKA